MKLYNAYLLIVVKCQVEVPFMVGLIPLWLDVITEKEKIAELLCPELVIARILVEQGVL